MIEFEAWPKIPRLNRDIVITEKIDGTNAAVVIQENQSGIEIGAQSRTRLITPEQDNHGFAKWVQENAAGLINHLGPGRHFGEWWGQGIQRKYGLNEHHFSLFNTERYKEHLDLADEPYFWSSRVPGLGVVPVLYRGPFNQDAVEDQVERLREGGSVAAPGFMRPEGIIVFHTASRSAFKVTLENDEVPKEVAGGRAWSEVRAERHG
jgi:hypothetical protein